MRITGRTFALRAAVAVVALLGVGLATQAPALAAPGISISLTRDQATVDAGENIDYHVALQNTGDVTLHNVTVTDANALDCQDPVPDLAPNATHTINCTYTTVGPTDIGIRSNQASVTTTETPSPTNSNTVTTQVNNPISIEKSATPEAVAAGTNINYTISVHNLNGASALTNVTVTDPNAPACALVLPSLAAGATHTYGCSYMTQNPADIGTYTNQATADADQANAVASNTTSTSVRAPTPGIEITKSRDEATVGAGDPIHYTLLIQNTGGVDLHNVTIDDDNAPGCETSPPGPNPPFDLTIAGPTSQHTINCTYTTTNADVGTRSNTAFANSDEGASDLSNPVSTTVQASNPQMTVTKSRDEASVFAGQTIHYHITVQNTGNRILTGFTVSDVKAPNCTSQVMPASLAPGANFTIDCQYVTQNPGDIGTYSNVATVDTAQTSPVPSNSVSTQVLAPTNTFTATKSVDESTVVAGADGVIHYHVTVTNTSNQPLTNISISDTNAPNCNANPGPQSVPDLAPGTGYTVDCSRTMPNTGANDTQSVSNTATVTGTVGLGPQPTARTTNTVTTSVQEPHPQLTIIKSRDEAVVGAGDPIHYHLHIENTGNVRATGIVIDDDNAPDCELVAVPDLDPGEDFTAHCSYTTSNADVGNRQNAAAVTFNAATTNPVASLTTTPAISNVVSTTVQVSNPAYTVTKTRDQAVVAAGDPITYHVTINNTGNRVLTDITLSDANAPNCNRAVAPAPNAIPPLDPGESYTVDCSRGTVNPTDIGTLTNQASVDTDQTLPVLSNTVSTNVQAPAPALTVVKDDVQNQVFAGQVINYTITLTNSGNQNLTGIFLTDTNAPDCNRSVGQIPDLTPGQSHTVNCSYTSQLSDSPSRPNSATADSDQTVGVLSNSVDTTVLTPSANMLVTKSVDENGVAVGQPIHYHINILNIGNQTLTGISILDANAPGCARAAGTLASLAPGADLTVNCSFTPNQNHIGVRTNTAVADSAQTSAVLSNQVSTNVHAVGTCLGATVTVYISDGDVPTGGADVIQGTSSGDSINGLGGNDRICALGGNDTVNGGAGNDRVNGDADNDTLLGSDGTDTLNGGPGTDTVHGDAGNDTVQGATDDDTLYGDAGTDSVTGGGGDDDLFGGTGADSLFGGENEDVLYGDTENDRLEGGNGADTEDGGAGLDTVLGNGGDDVLNGGTENDALGGGGGVDEVNGGPGIDSVNGNEGNDTVNGNEGNDLVVGAGGADTVHGGPNNDRAQGDGGNDHVFGDENNDQVLGGSGIDALDGGTETDSCAGGTGSPDSAVNCESTTGVP